MSGKDGWHCKSFFLQGNLFDNEIVHALVEINLGYQKSYLIFKREREDWLFQNHFIPPSVRSDSTFLISDVNFDIANINLITDFIILPVLMLILCCNL